MEILEKKKHKNYLLHREEVKLKVKADKISKEEAKEIVAKEFKANKELIVINKILGSFGKPEWNIDALIYENSKYLQIYEKLISKNPDKNEKEKKEQEAK